MSYVKTTNFAIKDTYLTGNPAKVIKGAEIDAEFNAIEASFNDIGPLGTAATANVTTSPTDTTSGRVWRTNDLVKQTSATDTTAGRMMAVGAFGLGATSGNDVTDANSATRNGFYRLTAPYTNSPDGVSAVDMFVSCWGVNVTQRACRSGLVGGINYVRSYNSNTTSWGAWKIEWDSGNLVPVDTTRIDVASASTVNLTSSAPSTRHINITGTTTITGFTVAAGLCYFVRFNAALTLTNNANIVTQSGANITTAAGDTCIIRATAANVVEVLSYKTWAIQKNDCTAWVNFNGTGTVAIRDSSNVSSITDNNVGDYTVNFAASMTNANYSMTGGNGPTNGSSPEGLVFGAGPTLSTDSPPTINGFRVLAIHAGTTAVDMARICVNVFGGK